MDRTMSTFRVLQTPVTSAPSAFAICTANVPTPPDAPMTRTVCPGRSSPLSRSPCSAVIAARGTAAACSIALIRVESSTFMSCISVERPGPASGPGLFCLLLGLRCGQLRHQAQLGHDLGLVEVEPGLDDLPVLVPTDRHAAALDPLAG